MIEVIARASMRYVWGPRTAEAAREEFHFMVTRYPDRPWEFAMTYRWRRAVPCSTCTCYTACIRLGVPASPPRPQDYELTEWGWKRKAGT